MTYLVDFYIEEGSGSGIEEEERAMRREGQ